MTYAVVPMEDMTKRLIEKAGCKSIDGLRSNADQTKVVVKVSDDNRYHFEKYTKFTKDEILEELSKSEWTGLSWFQNLFGG